VNQEIIQKILDLARWAPSGDNAQPWRFEVLGERTIRVHGFDTRQQVLYDFQGRASHIAHGALLETLRIAATGFGLRADWIVAAQGDEHRPVYEVTLTPDATVVRDPLWQSIERRTVQRRPMKTTSLTSAQRQALTTAAGASFRVHFFESAAQRWRIARMLWRSAHIRLTCPEAYPVHKAVIQWRAQFSKDRIPQGAVGVDPATARLMQWVLQSWPRVCFFNRFLLGTWMPRLQLDLLPGFFCAAHVLVQPRQKPVTLQDWVALGTAWQKIWLTATAQGLHLQPQMTPVIFRWYARAGQRFSAVPQLFDDAANLSTHFEKLVGATPDDDFGFFARIGTCAKPGSRSLRKDLPDLMYRN
jgi:Nitroreductase family